VKEEGGGYITRGRGAALERDLRGEIARLEGKIRELERRQDELQALPFELVRGLVTVTAQTFRAYSSNGATPAPWAPESEGAPRG
jgi:hypothetical protein